MNTELLVPTPIGEAFQAKVIEDSISPYGIRLITMQLRYPRFIHSEFMTHRDFSRNARSSRAVPVKRLLLEAPYVPHFKRNQSGMQAFEELPEDVRRQAIKLWLSCARECKDTAQCLGELDIHKQWANRMLEWFGYIDVVVSSTWWRNFYNLRDHPMAMPEIQHLAIAMREAMEHASDAANAAISGSIPKQLDFGEWHLPYALPEERDFLDDAKLLSTARCARVSYKPFDDTGEINAGKDIELAGKLIVAEPLHASPAEHQATPDDFAGPYIGCGSEPIWDYPEEHGNFYGWRQHRKMLPNEASKEDYSLESMLAYYDGKRPLSFNM
jgi:hypothetical protein